MDRIKRVTGFGSATEVLKDCQATDGWKNMIAEVCDRHGT